MKSTFRIRRCISSSRLAGLAFALLFGGLAVWSGCLGTTGTATVKIGLAAPFEGSQRALGYDALAAVKIAIREQNAAGGVAGRPVELVALNDDGEPQAAATQARKLAVDPSVIGAIGHWTRETTDAALSVYAEAGLPVVIPVSGAFERQEAGMIQLAPTDAELAGEVADYLSTRAPGVRVRLQVMPPSAADALRAALTARGIEILEGEGSVASGGAQHVRLLSLGYDETAQALREVYPSETLVLNDLFFPLLDGLIGGAPVGTVSGWILRADAQTAPFRAAFTTETGRVPSRQAVMAYRATRCLLRAADAAASLDRPGVAAALAETNRCGLDAAYAGGDAVEFAIP